MESGAGVSRAYRRLARRKAQGMYRCLSQTSVSGKWWLHSEVGKLNLRGNWDVINASIPLYQSKPHRVVGTCLIPRIVSLVDDLSGFGLNHVVCRHRASRDHTTKILFDSLFKPAEAI